MGEVGDELGMVIMSIDEQDFTRGHAPGGSTLDMGELVKAALPLVYIKDT